MRRLTGTAKLGQKVEVLPLVRWVYGKKAEGEGGEGEERWGESHGLRAPNLEEDPPLVRPPRCGGCRCPPLCER